MVSALVLAALVAAPIPTRLSADVSDAFALRTNPAGLGFTDGGEVRLLYGFEDGAALVPPSSQLFGARDAAPGVGRIHSGGLYGAFDLGALRLGAGYDFGDPSSGDARERGLLGFALRMDRAAIGLTYEQLSPAGGDEARGFVRVGGQVRPAQWISIGYGVDDIGEVIQQRDWIFGLAVRPFTERILLSTQWAYREETEADIDQLRFLGQIEPIDGVTLGFASDARFEDFNGQIAIDINRVGFEAAVFSRSDAAMVSSTVVARMKPRPSRLQPRGFMVARFEGDLVPDPNFSIFSGFSYAADGQAQLVLEKLAAAPDLVGAVIEIGALDVGWARVNELRRGILDARARGKQVLCVLTGADDRSYFLASACDRIAVLPAAVFAVNGIAAQSLYFGDTLSRIGIEVDAVRHGAYKSATETFTRSGPSPEAEEVRDRLLDVTYDAILDGIARGRSMDRAKVERWIQGGASTSTEALALGFVDTVLYEDELEDWVRGRSRGASLVDAKAYVQPQRPRWSKPDIIAVVPIDGAIIDGSSRRLPFGLARASGADTLVSTLEALRDESRVAAVVLRIDSPGGDAIASDRIARAVERLAEEKPVVASMGDVAASGGYYVAAPARHIMAEPTTITGSIGIFSIRASFAGLLARFGIGTSVEERGEYAAGSSPLQPLDPADRAPIEKQIDFLYGRFLDVVAKGRGMERAEVRRRAEGRVWIGSDALDQGLVDALGGLTDAVQWARAEAGLERRTVDVRVFPDEIQDYPGDLGRLLPPRSAGAEAPDEAPWWGLVPDSLRPHVSAILASGGRPLALTERVLTVR